MPYTYARTLTATKWDPVPEASRKDAVEALKFLEAKQAEMVSLIEMIKHFAKGSRGRTFLPLVDALTKDSEWSDRNLGRLTELILNYGIRVNYSEEYLKQLEMALEHTRLAIANLKNVL